LSIFYPKKKISSRGVRICEFVKVKHSHVRVSHYLANLARAECRTFIWLGSGPDDTLQMLDHDRFITFPVE
jgi:hypothetical protein